MNILPLPCKLLVDKTPSLAFNGFSSDIKNVDTQVESFGINSSTREFTLTWSTLTIAEKDSVESFLKQVGTWYSFLITETSTDTEQIRVHCTEAYSITITNNLFTITTQVQEVFR